MLTRLCYPLLGLDEHENYCGKYHTGTWNAFHNTES